MPTFEELKNYYWNHYMLYEDPDFPANYSILYIPEKETRAVIWKRPREICGTEPLFIREADYFDINQGALGDCYFLAAVNSLMVADKKLLNRVIPRDQNFQDKYAGIFRFNFWHNGYWKEIIIDDLLPIIDQRLFYSSNKNEKDEFWICLLEKAYAKLYGSYEHIHGGYPEDAIADLTGGISEIVRLNSNVFDADQIFKELSRIHHMDSIITLTINSHKDRTRERANGLVEGHAYAFTGITTVQTYYRTEKLIRIRNPWGEHEWNGAWSDNSPEWNSISVSERKKIGLENKDNGEFWMRLEEAISEFDDIIYCHNPQPMESDPDNGKVRWRPNVFNDRFMESVSSGGSDKNSDIYWRNPQYIIDLEHHTDPSLVVISLMEVMCKGRSPHAINFGFDIYKMNPGKKLPSSYRFDKESTLLHSFGKTSSKREMSINVELPPGVYVVVMYNTEMTTCDFLLRIYSECEADVFSVDDVVHSSPVGEIKTVLLKLGLEKLGDKVTGPVDAFMVQSIIQDTWRTEFQTELGITLETARCLMTLAVNGLIDHDGVRKTCEILSNWLNMFQKFDKDKSGTIDISELEKLLSALGFKVGRKIVVSIAIRYGGKDKKLTFDDLIQCMCRLFSIKETHPRLGLDISLNAYISEVMRT